ncbi:MAG: hypothetical protein PHW13_01040 [Methylococcales bacterium]|nr:hypothetical protein [Methylococcales bacterium]
MNTLDSQAVFFRLGFKILLAWVVVSLSLLQGGEYLLQPLLPACQALIRELIGGWLPHLSIAHGQGGGILQLQVWVLSAMPVAVGVVIPKGAVLNSSIHVIHIFVPVAMLLTMLLVWPVRGWLQKVLLLGIGGLFSVLMLLLTVPVLLIAILEIPYQEAAQSASSLYQPPWFMDWMVFYEMGGNLLLAVFGGFLSVWVKQCWFKDVL